jgi:MFS family permease
VLFPLLAKIQSAHHLRTYGLGLMSGATFLASLVSQVAVARLLDGRLGRPVLLCGLALAALSPAWFSVAGSLWSLTAARAVGGASYGIVMPAALRAGTAGVPEDKRGLRLGILSSAQMAGIVAGPLVGVILYSVGGIALPFQVVAAVGAAVFLAVLTSRSAAVTTGIPHENRRGEDPARPMVASPAVVAVLILAAAAQLPNGFYDALWSRLLTDRGASTLLIGLSLAMFGLPFVVLAPFGGRLAGRSPIVWATGGLVVSAGFMASYGVIDSPAIIVVLGMFEACAWAVAVPASYAATARAIPDKWAATGQGWSSGAGTTAAGLAAIASAPSYQAFGPGPVFAGGAALSAAGALVAAAVWRRYSAADGRSAAEPVPVSTVPSPGTPLPASRQ